MAKKLQVKVGRVFSDTRQSPAKWLRRCIPHLIEREKLKEYDPTSIKMYVENEFDGIVLWVEMDFKKTKHHKVYGVHIVDLKPDQAKEIESWMNGVTCDTGLKEIARTEPIEWNGGAIGIVIVK